MLTSKEIKKQEGIEASAVRGWALILHNDEVNTFDYVIDQLVSYCDHSAVQAEQCATITHLMGKCDILVGEMAKLEAIKEQLQQKSLSVTLDAL